MRKIVVADDSNLIRMKLKKHLQDEFQVIEAVNGRDALVKIKIEHPDIVLSDLLMPEMDGFELLRRIQLDGLQVPVVVLTADIQVETNQKCTDLGAFKVLNKPPNKDELIAALNNALEAKASA
jgi:CheY-like chemotaxis protein